MNLETLDATDQRLLELMRDEFPLEHRPFRSLGQKLGLTEDDVLKRAERLKGQGPVHRLAAVFDPQGLGYGNGLVAIRVPPAGLEKAVATLAAHPGVSHIYQRDHDFPLWFTFAAPGDRDLEVEARALAGAAGCDAPLVLPTLKAYKADSYGAQGGSANRGTKNACVTQQDKNAVRALQEDLPLLSRAYYRIATSLGWEECRLFQWITEARQRGMLRRFGVILYQPWNALPVTALSLWQAPEEKADLLGPRLAACAGVSHCYLRPARPGWAYNLYGLIHAPSRQDCEAYAKGIRSETGLEDGRLLYSKREFKKEWVRYFTEAPGREK